MKSIRWKLVFIYLTLVFIVMIISGTFIIVSSQNQEMKKAEEDLKQCALYVYEQIIQEYETPEDFQDALVSLFIARSSMSNIQANILNSYGETIASSAKSDKSQFLEYKNSVVISALAGKEGFTTNGKNIDYNQQVKDWVSYAYPVFDNDGRVQYVIYTQLDAEAINESLLQISNTIFISVLIALIFTGVLGIIFANTITVPISELTKKANQLAEGNLEQNIVVKSNDEIGQLTKSFNYMANELRKTLSSMKNENSKLEIVLSNMTDGVLAFDKDGLLIHANPACYNMIELHNDLTLEHILKRVNFSKSDLTPGVITETIKKENDKYISVSFIPYSDNKNRFEGVVIMLQDITKHRRLDDMRKEFVANVSHEIRTPLTNIRSYAETLLDGALDDRETALEFLNIILGEADRITVLTKDLLELSHLDNKQMKFNFRRLNLVDFMRDCYKQNLIAAKNKNQTIEFIEPKDYDMYINADNARINQVVTNIISNAMKYSGEGATIKISFYQTNDKNCVMISDNGMGMPKEDLGRIFERFYRVDKARSRAMGGNGLGLSIAKEIMEGHGGAIEAASELDVGTTMTLIFPKATKISSEHIDKRM